MQPTITYFGVWFWAVVVRLVRTLCFAPRTLCQSGGLDTSQFLQTTAYSREGKASSREASEHLTPCNFKPGFLNAPPRKVPTHVYLGEHKGPPRGLVQWMVVKEATTNRLQACALGMQLQNITWECF